MSLFRSDEEVDVWCARAGTPRGAVLTLAQVWELAQAWYGNRTDPDYRGRTTAQAVELFRQLGLTSEFWQASVGA